MQNIYVQLLFQEDSVVSVQAFPFTTFRIRRETEFSQVKGKVPLYDNIWNLSD